MSHGHERIAKDCLNCGTIVKGRYCQACGQENIEPKESFWSMLRHFFEDITHFDGKFFATLKVLLIKPGFLSKEYIAGKRSKYLHPVRMYVFTSAFFFLIFFSLQGKIGPAENEELNNRPLTNAQRDSIVKRLNRKIKSPASADQRAQLSLLKDSSRPVTFAQLEVYENYTTLSPWGTDYKTRAKYDSAQLALPKENKDGFIKGLWNRRAYSMNDKYRHNSDRGSRVMIDGFLHRLPYLLFVSLPFFALLLKLLYFRRKNFFYADHAIFTIHHYILSFILLLLVFGFGELSDLTGWGIFTWINVAIMIFQLLSLFFGMKRFYGQNGWKTFLKYLLLNIGGFIVIISLLMIFFLLAVFQS